MNKASFLRRPQQVQHLLGRHQGSTSMYAKTRSYKQGSPTSLARVVFADAAWIRSRQEAGAGTKETIQDVQETLRSKGKRGQTQEPRGDMLL